MNIVEAIPEALHLPRRFAQASWPRRLAAVAIFVAATAGVWWAMHLPVAMPVEDAAGWQAMSDDEIRLVGPVGPSMLAFQGPVGQGVTLSFDSAKVSPRAASSLSLIRMPVPPAAVPIDWVLDRGGCGRAMVRFDLVPAGPNPALLVRMTGGPGQTGLTFTGADARLAVGLAGALVEPGPDDPECPPSSGKPPLAHIRLDGKPFDVTAGAIPLEAEAPPGASVTLTYVHADPDRGVFRWGVRPDRHQRASDLTLAAVQLRREGEPDRVAACAPATSWKVAFSGAAVSQLRCAPGLHLRGLDLARSGTAVQVTGLGFVAEKGKAHVYSWKEFKENPLIDGLAGAAFAGLVGWTLHTVLGKPKRAHAKPKPRRVAKAA